MSRRRQTVADAPRVVVKLGSAVLTGGAERLDEAYLHDVAAQLAAAGARGRDVIVVSSGSVAAGLGEIGKGARPTDLRELQAAAAIGQPTLIALWRRAFGVRTAAVAQMLLGRADFDDRARFLNIRNCITHLLAHGVVPIVNENDSVATEEISLGDNDILAAKLAVAVHAGALLLLTTAPGVQDADGSVIPEADDAAALRRHVRPGGSAQGRGGMTTKIEAARIASASGVATVIGPGRPALGVGAMLAGEDVGTLVHPVRSRHAGRRAWIAAAATPAGDLAIDDGAVRALTERRASLLAKGVTGVAGAFGPGDVVRIVGAGGVEVGRGLSNLAAAEVRAVMGRDSSEHEALLGRRVHEEVVHRDNLALAVDREGPAG